MEKYSITYSPLQISMHAHTHSHLIIYIELDLLSLNLVFQCKYVLPHAALEGFADSRMKSFPAGTKPCLINSLTTAAYISSHDSLLK